MHPRTLAVSVALAAALDGCGSHEETSMGASARSLDAQAERVRAVETAHEAVIRSAPSVSVAEDAESHHCMDLAGPLASMRDECNAMMSCAGDQTANVRATLDLAERARNECAMHTAAMAHATDMASMMDEENRHHAAMADWMDEWSGIRTSMMGDGSMMGGGDGPSCGRGGMM